MSQYTFNPPDTDIFFSKLADALSEAEKNGGDKPRIYNEMKTSMVLDELSMVGESQDKTRKNEDNISVLFPLIKINDYYISDGELVSFHINSEGKIPRCRISVRITKDSLITKNMPKDGDIMSVMIRSKSDVLKPVRNDYIITDVFTGDKISAASIGTDINIYGDLFIPGIYNYLSGYSKKGTSMEAMRGAAKILGLGFNTNEDSTDDSQLWIMKDNFYQFLDDTCERSWKDENSFFDWWIDIYYNLNFVNVQKQLLAKEDDIDLAAVINSSNTEFLGGDDSQDKPIMPKVFCNSASFLNTAFYVVSWSTNNFSSSISRDYGLSIFSNFFEHNDLLYNDPDSEKVWSIRIDPAYDADKIDRFIVLRGRPYWDKDKNPEQLAITNYDYNELFKKYVWNGIQYTVSNPDEPIIKWTGNHHKNYMRAKVHNIINNVELDRLFINLNVGGVNLNIITGDKIPVVIVKGDQEERIRTTPDLPALAVDLFYSGWYYVKGFSIYWSSSTGEGPESNFRQTFVLSRREWPAPVPVVPIKEENNKITA